MNKNQILKFFGYKLIRFIILMIVVAIFSFILLDLSPINPVTTYLKGAAVSEGQRAILESYFGVNVPLPTKIYHWLLDLVQGNLGTSLIYRAPVIDIIFEKFMASIVLMAISWILSGVLGFVFGVVAGKNKGSLIDKAVKVYCYAIQSAPSFWVGMLILMVFSVYLGWFPIGFGVPIGVRSTDATFMEWATRLVLPTLTLSLVGLAPIAMYTRNELIQVLSSDYVLFAKSRGEKGWDLVKNHGIRNILLPAITLQFLSFSELFVLASNMQNTELRQSITLYDIFSDHDLYRNWIKENAWWYINYGGCTLNGGTQPYSQRNLLRKIINDADSCLKLKNPSVQLRFGHDIVILPLACLMDINHWGLATNRLGSLGENGWSCYNIVPMAANIQLIFYRSNPDDQDVWFKVLFNEDEATLPLPGDHAPYYRWSDFRSYYLKKLDGYEKH